MISKPPPRILQEDLPSRDPFTTADAIRAGWSHWAIRAEVLAGRWVAMRHGVLCTSGRERAAVDVQTRHALDVAAARLAIPRPTVASGWSAAILAGLPLPHGRGPSPAGITLTTSVGRGRTLGDIRLRAAPVPDDEVVVCLGVPTTSPARTAVDLALDGIGFADELAVVDAVLHRGLTTVAGLTTILARFRASPGYRRASRTIGLADSNAETPLESHSRAWFVAHRIPMPRSQVEICDEHGGFVARVDFLWPGVVGEADGRLKYADAEDVYREKRREDRLRELGFEVVRWDYSDIWSRPRQTAVRVQAAIRRATRRSAAMASK